MNDFEQALDAYHQALILNSDTTDALLGIITILQETGRGDEAEDFIRQTVSLEPRSIELLFDILHFYDKDEQAEKLKELFQLTIEQIENKEEFLYFFTVFCCNVENKEEILPLGIELLNDYLADEDVALSIPYLLAALYYVSGNHASGRNYLSNALLINYEDHTRFLNIHPSLSEIEDVRVLIERYR
jgi:tetratricopeptide (TPR) repeat protein